MFNFLKSKTDPEAKKSEESDGDGENPEEESQEKVAASNTSSGDAVSLVRISTEMDRMKVNVEGFKEVRKTFSERFERISEQIGELRSMILERDKTIQEIELKSMKASDLVESVHPERISTEIQKQDAKLEALKANLEGNESIMSRILEELKEVKRKIEFFKGVEEIVNLSEEVKKELIEIKKVESKIGLDADKVETIYAELRKKFQEVDAFTSDVQEMKVLLEQNTKDIRFLKDKISSLAGKDELEGLVKKVQRYVDVLKEIQKKSSLTKDIDTLKTLLEGL